MAHHINIQLPPRCTLHLLANGAFRLYFEGASVVPLQQALLGAASRLLETAIASTEAARQAEVQRQQLPETRLQLIDRELAALTAQRNELAANLPTTSLEPPAVAPPAAPEQAQPVSPVGIGQELLARALGVQAVRDMGGPAPAQPGSPHYVPTVNPGEAPTPVQLQPYDGPLF